MKTRWPAFIALVATVVLGLPVYAAVGSGTPWRSAPRSAAATPGLTSAAVRLKPKAVYQGTTSQPGKTVYLKLSANGKKVKRYILRFLRDGCNFGNGAARGDSIANIRIRPNGKFSTRFRFKAFTASTSRRKRRGTVQGGGVASGSVKGHFDPSGNTVTGTHRTEFKKRVTSNGRTRRQVCRQKVTFTATKTGA